MADSTDRADEGVTDLNEAAVADYLRRHPDFLHRYPKIVEALEAPDRFAETNGQVVDLQRFMVDRLRNDIDAAHSRTAALIDTSRENLVGQRRIHEAVLAMLGATDIDQFIDIVTTDFAVVLDVDVVAIALEMEIPGLSTELSQHVAVLDPGMVEQIFPSGSDALLRDADQPASDRAAIYGGGAGLIDSDAVLRLRVGPLEDDAPAINGLMAFGAREPDKFSPDQGAELLLFLARALERTLTLWLLRG